MLLIVAATEPELRGSLGRDGSQLPGTTALACGVGPVEAAARTATLLAREPRPDALLHVGIAGARRSAAIPPGTIVVGDRSTYDDTTSRLVTRELRPDPVLLARARAALPKALVLPIGTSADVGGTATCDVEAMEGFGVLLAAARAGVPALEVRAVSNEIEEADRSRWHFDVALAALRVALPLLVQSAGVVTGRPNH